jgi:hypothetical protein
MMIVSQNMVLEEILQIINKICVWQCLRCIY